MSQEDQTQESESPRIASALIGSALRIALLWWLAQTMIVLSLALVLPHLDGCTKDSTLVESPRKSS